MERETIRIPSAPDTDFIPDPWAIFNQLLPEAEELRWVLWGETWLTAKPDSDLKVVELEERVHSTPRGVFMDWTELSELLDDLSQVIDGTFVGCSDPEGIPMFPGTSLDRVHRDHPLVVTAEDSTYWWVSGDTSVTSRLLSSFPHAERRPGFE